MEASERREGAPIAVCGNQQKKAVVGHGKEKLHISLTRNPETLPEELLREYEPVGQDLLGEGAFAVVRLLRQRATGKLFALKCVEKYPLKIRDMIPQMNREVRIQKALSHPNILQLVRTFDDNSYLFMLLEYCEKGPLRQIVVDSSHGRLEEHQAAFYFRQIARGVEWMHRHNCVHRDLKLENMLLTQSNELKICDFGWSAEVEIEKMLKTVCGTTAYWPPEIWENAQQDESVDMWALGCLLYEMLAGHPPFFGKDQQELKNKVLSVDTRLAFPPWFTAEVVHTVKCLLRRNPRERIKCKDLLNVPWLLKHAANIVAAPPQVVKTNPRASSWIIKQKIPVVSEGSEESEPSMPLGSGGVPGIAGVVGPPGGQPMSPRHPHWHQRPAITAAMPSQGGIPSPAVPGEEKLTTPPGRIGMPGGPSPRCQHKMSPLPPPGDGVEDADHATKPGIPMPASSRCAVPQPVSSSGIRLPRESAPPAMAGTRPGPGASRENTMPRYPCYPNMRTPAQAALGSSGNISRVAVPGGPTAAGVMPVKSNWGDESFYGKDGGARHPSPNPHNGGAACRPGHLPSQPPPHLQQQQHRPQLQPQRPLGNEFPRSPTMWGSSVATQPPKVLVPRSQTFPLNTEQLGLELFQAKMPPGAATSPQGRWATGGPPGEAIPVGQGHNRRCSVPPEPSNPAANMQQGRPHRGSMAPAMGGYPGCPQQQRRRGGSVHAEVRLQPPPLSTTANGIAQQQTNGRASPSQQGQRAVSMTVTPSAMAASAAAGASGPAGSVVLPAAGAASSLAQTQAGGLVLQSMSVPNAPQSPQLTRTGSASLAGTTAPGGVPAQRTGSFFVRSPVPQPCNYYAAGAGRSGNPVAAGGRPSTAVAVPAATAPNVRGGRNSVLMPTSTSHA